MKFFLDGMIYDDIIKVKTTKALEIMLLAFNETIEEQFDKDQTFQFGSLKEVSITSYGDQILNNISKLIDYYETLPKQRINEITRISALVIQSLDYLINSPQSEEYFEALRMRYVNNDNAQNIRRCNKWQTQLLI